MQGQSSNAIVGEAVRTLRLELGLSQEKFATKCGLHRTYIGAIERAEENITLNTLDKVAKALGVPPAKLLARVR